LVQGFGGMVINVGTLLLGVVLWVLGPEDCAWGDLLSEMGSGMADCEMKGWIVVSETPKIIQSKHSCVRIP
jgi:hypothetical protein